MILLSLVLISTGCEERIDPPAVNPSEGKTVIVTFNLGIASEEDGAGASASPTSKASSNSGSALEVVPVSDVQTKSGTDIPDQLYNLEIIQYSSTGSKLKNQNLTATTGTTFTASLQAESNCKLLLIARGSSNYFNGLSGKTTLDDVQSTTDIIVKAKTSSINGIATDATGPALANMPYYLLLEDVNIIYEDGRYKIQSPQGKDVRLLLKRLAVKVKLDWILSSNMIADNYTLKEVKLCQVPAHYRLIPQTEPTDKWGKVYPGSVAEFVDVYRLTGTELDNANGTKTVWIPANARGISSYSNSPYYRNKTNANPAATYAEFVVDNSEKKERLYYRVYLGGNETDDFNLLENTNYHWTVKINKADYANDPRIQLLDQTPVISTNEQPTSNCFMMLPGTNICFNPYKHEAGTDGWNTNLTSGGTISKTITSVKVLWQTKDAGTSGDLVMGYVASDDNHKNLVNYGNLDNPSLALVHVKVPVTNGGNAVIAAYSGETVVWSWHLWISNYVPVRINSYSEYEEAQAKTKNGTVHKYRSALFNEGQKYADWVMMDRDLGAVAGGYPAIYKGENYTVRDNVETQGFLYQGARKDPFFVSADGTTNEVDVIYDGDGVTSEVKNINRNEVSNKYEYSIQHPLHFIYGEGGIGSSPNSWDNNGKKTIDDPCPAGWRVPLFEGGASSNFSGSIFDGFQAGGNISGSGNDSEYVISGNNEFNYSSYFLTDKLVDKAPGSSPDKNPKGGRLFYLGENKQVEKTIHNTVWFPVSAERLYTTAQLNAPLYAHIWFANNASGNFMFGSGMKPHAMRVIRYAIGYGWPVRCIQYNKIQ